MANMMLGLLQRRAKVIADARAIVAKASNEGRSLHLSEQAEVDRAIAAAEGINSELNAMLPGRGAVPTPRRADLSGTELLDSLETRVGADLSRIAPDPAAGRRRTPSRASEGLFRPDETVAVLFTGVQRTPPASPS